MIRFLGLLMATALPACAALAPSPAPARLSAPMPAFASDRIGVTVRGEGSDVILIPGLSSSPEVWETTIAAMPGYRYHLVHVAGFAGRPVGANGAGPVVAPVAEEIARYIREAGLDRPAIVGHSLGGFWGMMIAARHPQLASRVMVVDMMPFMGAMFGGPNATPESLRPIAEQFRQGIASSAGPQRDTIAKAMIDSMVRTEGLRPQALRHSLDSDPAVSGQAMYDLIITNLIPELGRIQVPLTILWVRAPNAPVTEEQMAGYYRASYAGVPHARLVNVPDSYHFIMWDAPEAFRRELATFLGAR